MKYSTFICLLFCFSLWSIKAYGQLPKTELFMLELDSDDEIEQISYLSSFNPNSYNNQAVFISSDEILLTAQLDKDNTDIVRLNLKANTVKRLTKTKESEYSPQVSGSGSFTVVRVEQDGVTQNLWEYPLSLENTGSILMNNTGQVGYYQALPNMRMAMFIIDGQQFDLYIANLRNESKKLVENNIGRCFKTSKKRELIYLSKSEFDDKGQIKVYNSINESNTVLAPAIEGSEDFCLYGNTELLIMAKGTSLFKYDSNSSTWLLWKDLSQFGLEKITRLDCRANKILIINNKS